MYNYLNQYIDIIRLSRAENVGSKTFFDLMKLYGDASRAISMLPELAKKGGRLKDIIIPSKEEIEKELELSEKIGAKLVTYKCPEYPEELLQIPDLPAVITLKGDASLLVRKKLAIVGARNCSINGKNFAYKVAKELSEAGIVIVSGLARGIDGAAHLGSLENGTIAVIAGGIDNIYPPEHKELYKKISENGLIIAESPYGASPRGQHFPRRNRIIAGLSRGVAIIEAAYGSGSLITARMALEYNKDIFAMPGFPLDPRSAGTNNLIKQGANLLLSAGEIIDYFGQSSLIKPEKILPKEPIRNESKKINNNDEQIETIRNDVQKLLSNYPLSVEELIKDTKYDISVVLTILLELELAGKINRHRDNKVSLTLI